jgi:Skp family chaperone for outer membrane proteins
MKKFMYGVVVTFLCMFGMSYAAVSQTNNKATKTGAAVLKGLVSINSVQIMQESKEGQALAAEIKKELEGFQLSVQNKQKELVDFQEKVKKQAKVLSKDALVEKGEQLAKMKKNAERELADSEESLKKSIQRRQAMLQNKLLKVTNEIFENNDKWQVMIDRSQALFVKNSIDVTDLVLKEVNSRYDSEFAKSVVKTQKNKSSLTAKAA